MRRVFLLLLLMVCVCGAAAAQTLSGALTGALAGGWRTNAYLEPSLRVWRVAERPAFFDVRPSASLRFRGDRTRIRASVAGFSEVLSEGVGGEAPRTWTGHLAGARTLGASWTAGFTGGRRSVRMSGRRTTDWIAARMRWHPGRGFVLTAQPAWTAQAVTTSYGHRAQYRSWTGLLRATYWSGPRWRLRASGFLSDGGQPAGTTEFRGTGAELGVRYHPTARWTLGVQAGLQEVGYRFGSPGGGQFESRETDTRLADVGLETQRRVGDRLALFAELRLLGARDPAAAGPSELDLRAGGGVRVTFRRTLWRGSDRSRARTWRGEDGRLHLEVRYRGPGRLYLTGSFNRWADPGRPLRRTDERTHVVVVDLPPGRYEYAIRIVGDEGRDWLDLPESVPTVDDGFGRENGVLYVREGGDGAREDGPGEEAPAEVDGSGRDPATGDL